MLIDKSRIYTYIAAAAAFLQVSVPQWHLADTTTQLTSAILLTVVSVFTILKQRISIEVSNSANIATYFLIAIALAGGINEVLGIVHINAHTQGILRSVLASVIGLLNLASKSLFPTDAGKVIQQTKVEIKEIKDITKSVPSD